MTRVVKIVSTAIDDSLIHSINLPNPRQLFPSSTAHFRCVPLNFHVFGVANLLFAQNASSFFALFRFLARLLLTYHVFCLDYLHKHSRKSLPFLDFLYTVLLAFYLVLLPEIV